MKIRPASNQQRLHLAYCLGYLYEARNLAIRADCPKLAEKIRSAIKSQGGAHRHVMHRMSRTNKDGTVRNWRDAT